MAEPTDQYNVVTLRNIDDEDFQFAVDGQPYMLPAGETRRFPRFMAQLAVKHLIDKILNKKDPKGTLVAKQTERDSVASQIVQGEEEYIKPTIPSDTEIVEDINKPSELDAVLGKNKARMRQVEPAATLPPQEEPEPAATMPTVPTTAPQDASKAPEAPTAPTESFIGLKRPSRDEMLSYAKNTLKLDLDDPKTKAAFEKMDDEALYKELGMEHA